MSKSEILLFFIITMPKTYSCYVKTKNGNNYANFIFDSDILIKEAT